jgi:hypothetical protein
MRWASPVVRMKEIRNGSNTLLENPEGTRTLGTCGVDRMAILEWILEK